MNSTIISKVANSGNEYSESLGPFILALDILEIIVGVVAVLINSLVIYILTSRLKLRQSDTVLSFVVSIFDVIYSILSIINYLVLWITNHSAILVTIYSQLEGYLCFCLGACVADSVMLLSLIRFLAIYKQVHYSSTFWVALMLGLVIFNFMLGLIPLVQNQFKVQPSLKYSSVVFSFQNNWSVNFYYCFLWIKLIINVMIVTICYIFISIFYYNYLKNYTKESLENEALPKFNWRDLNEIQFDSGSIQLELDRDSNCQRKEESRRATIVSDNIAENPVITTGQSGLGNNYTIDSLIRSTLSKLYIMIIIYIIITFPVLLNQTIFKFLSIHISPVLDSIGGFLFHLLPIANPCFVLFFHFETYQELRFFICLNYYKFFKHSN
jgi:hypothetical protein